MVNYFLFNRYIVKRILKQFQYYLKEILFIPLIINTFEVTILKILPLIFNRLILNLISFPFKILIFRFN